MTTSASTTSSARSRMKRRCRSTTKAAWLNWPSPRARNQPSTQSSRKRPRGRRVERKERLKTRWAQLEAIVGTEKRLKLVARDIVAHFEERLEALDGKAMVVCMSRRICVTLYRELVRLRPDWHHADDDKGRLKVVMTGAASDPPDWQPLIRNKARREALANRFRGSRRSATHGAGTRHVADRLRCAEPAHHVCGQADARPRPDEGNRPGQPRVQGQAGGARGRLPGLSPRAETSLGDLHRKRRHRKDRARSRGSGGGDAGEVRNLRRSVPRLRPVQVDCRYASGTPRPATSRAGAHPDARKRQGPLRAVGARTLPSLRARCAPRGRDPHPRRRGLLPSCPVGAGQARVGRCAPRRGAGSCRAPDHLPSGGIGRGDRHLRRRWTGET